MAVDVDVEQSGVECLALDDFKCALQGCDGTDDRASGLAEDHLDQRRNHRLVFDDQHAPAREPHDRLSNPFAARLALPSGRQVATVLLGWAAEEESVHRNASNCLPQCYSEPSGILRFTLSPLCSNSIRAFPPRPWPTSRSIRVSPKPGCGAFPTGGPPRSTQSSTRLLALRFSIAQVTSSDPPAMEREPYFTALVPSSCSTIPSDSANFGLSATAGPSMTRRSPRPT